MTPPAASQPDALTPHDFARLAAQVAVEKKAEGAIILDLRKLTSVCDYFVIVTGASEPQIKAIAEHVEEELKPLGAAPWHVEGLENRRWVILDYVDFVVHVFSKESRDNYVLERLWGDAPREDVTVGRTGT